MLDPKLPTSPFPAPQPTRREFIHLTAGAMGVVGLGAAAWPFINSMNPSADVMALSSIEIDISAIPKGQTHTVMWRGRPVFVRHRTEEEIKEMRKASLKHLPDPETDEQRTKDPNWLVVVGVCTHLGCIPTQRKDMQPSNQPDIGWVCSCHGSKYDYSGRIISGPAPKNLEVPVYEFTNPNTVLRIG
ncbi:MAG: ubiquinol-cytochrome reductase [Alphaproteobacteria bacterium]|nr:ubiquinol-cytochrome reductase [Alphaproteobacteria bacterium]MDF3034063.1 ubiquinol-cytochrome reductase [Alphaproteobacteria bacterium]